MGLTTVFKDEKMRKLRILVGLTFFSALIYMVVGIEHEEVVEGFLKIITSHAALITDYLVIGGMGGTFLNAFLIFTFNYTLMRILGVPIKGLAIAAFFMLFGFSFFGKNILNVLPFYLGGILYSKYSNKDFKDILITIFFTSALAPYVSEVAFKINAGKSAYVSALALGTIIGFVVVPIAEKMAGFHEGYNLYNLGFTAGIIGAVISAILRAYHFDIMPRRIISLYHHNYILILCIICFTSLFIMGFVANNYTIKGLDELLKDTGFKADYIEKYGFGVTFMNMGIMGFVALAYVLFFREKLSGPILAGVLSVVGFSAYGKHIKNTVPVLIGVALASIYTTDDTFVIVLSALFGTALAPVSGVYGPIWGVIAGWMHLSVTQSVGAIHGGLNLYNNGFSAGLVVGVLLPLMKMVRANEENRKNAYLLKKRELYESMRAFREQFKEEIIQKEDDDEN